MASAPKAVRPAVNAWQPEYLEAQYERYRADPQSVSDDVRAFFQGFEVALAKPDAGADSTGVSAESTKLTRDQYAVSDLIGAYREVGHVAASLDPFGRTPERPESLGLAYHGLSEDDLDKVFDPGTLSVEGEPTLRNIIDRLEVAYCRSVGAEFMHIQDSAERDWLLHRFEAESDGAPLDKGMRVHVLQQLLKAEQFEKFLGKRYPGEKRFSLEGAESLIPLLDSMVEQAAAVDVEEIVLGMAHRGRLNVLNNILGKSYEQVFTEFEDSWEVDFADGGGDVKYHRGYSANRTLPSGRTIHLALASNPSHLESVNAVVEGRCRAKQFLRADHERRRVIPLLIHGDAAVIAQGTVQEVLNLSQLEGYTTGGTIHVVVNNLIGFTTAPTDARSSRYCTDIAKMIGAPVFHVNGEDPDALVALGQLAVDYRQRFRKDVFIDLYCFRRYGHNEQDEASFTQPILTKLIKESPGVLESYAKRLFKDGVIDASDMTRIRERLDEALEQAQEAAQKSPYDPTIDPGSDRWKGFDRAYSHEPVDTAVTEETIAEVCDALGRVPESFNLNRKLKSLLKARRELPKSRELSYGDAESLAFGCLLLEGIPVRLTGQDSRRGTFSHRHGVLRDAETGDPYTPLNHIREVGLPGTDTPPGSEGPDGKPRQALFELFDSPLSEASIVGFEYGYSLGDPHMLVCWEAQFGDFVNGAQVIIDQYIAAAELKWDRWSGLVLLLPHGYEGAGPEHSSCRMERFLQLCANDNLQVVYPSNAAQAFHMFRRQVKTKSFRKPLIVMTPKSMLRVPTSSIDELIEGRFETILDDPTFGDDGEKDRAKVERLLLCSGKIYYDLHERREQIGASEAAIVRVEQLHPFDADRARDVLDRYPNAAQWYWVQEEPRNAGAYHFIADRFRTRFGRDLEFVGRAASATPAVGSKRAHKIEQEAIIARAVGPAPSKKSPAPDEKANGEKRPKKDDQAAPASDRVRASA